MACACCCCCCCLTSFWRGEIRGVVLPSASCFSHLRLLLLLPLDILQRRVRCCTVACPRRSLLIGRRARLGLNEMEIRERRLAARNNRSMRCMKGGGTCNDHCTTYMNIQKRKYRICCLLIVGRDRRFRRSGLVAVRIGEEVTGGQ